MHPIVIREGHFDPALSQIPQELLLIALLEAQGNERVMLGKFEHDRGHVKRRERGKASDGYFTAIGVAQSLSRLRELLGVLQKQSCLCNESLPGRRKRNAFRVMADEDRDAEHLLEFGDGG